MGSGFPDVCTDFVSDFVSAFAGPNASAERGCTALKGTLGLCCALVRAGACCTGGQRHGPMREAVAGEQTWMKSVLAQPSAVFSQELWGQ